MRNSQRAKKLEMNPKLKVFLIFIVGAMAGIGVMSLIKQKDELTPYTKLEEYQKPKENSKKDTRNSDIKNSEKHSKSSGSFEIDELTSEKVVLDYLKANNNRLPDYYITKKQAKQEGWVASKGNLCDVLPGRAIGGDKFTNREKNLPAEKGRQYYEADLNYNCGRRNADRVVFSNDGLIFVTKDHYKSFKKEQ